MIDTEPVSLILNKVRYTRAGDGYSFKCPAHDDNSNSGAVKADGSGNAILKCFAGCSRKAICNALGITERDLYVASDNFQPQPSNKSPFEILQVYPYRDARGNLLFEKLRMKQFKTGDPKCLIRRAIDGVHLWGKYAGWFEKKRYKWQLIKNANDPSKQPLPSARWFDACPKVLYRLPELKALPAGSLLLYVEGEKDAETARRLGFEVTTAGSSSSWNSCFAADLEGFDLVIIPDNDESGRQCAAKMVRDCQGIAARIRVVELPGLPEKGDLSDWVAASGTREELLNLIAATDVIEPTASTIRIGKHLIDLNDESEIDISGLQEIDDDDPIISNDYKLEAYLRQLPRNTALILDAYAIYMKLLGFEEKGNLRILAALTQLGGARTKPFRATNQQLQKKYAGGPKAASDSTVKRDKERLLKEQWRLDVALIGYRSFSYNPETQNCPPSEYQNHLLRKSLEAIAMVVEENPQDKFIDRTKLEEACKRLVPNFPKPLPKITKKKNPRKGKKPETNKVMVKFRRVLDELYEQQQKAGFNPESIENWINECVHDHVKAIVKSSPNMAHLEPSIEDHTQSTNMIHNEPYIEDQPQHSNMVQNEPYTEPQIQPANMVHNEPYTEDQNQPEVKPDQAEINKFAYIAQNEPYIESNSQPANIGQDEPYREVQSQPAKMAQDELFAEIYSQVETRQMLKDPKGEIVKLMPHSQINEDEVTWRIEVMRSQLPKEGKILPLLFARPDLSPKSGDCVSCGEVLQSFETSSRCELCARATAILLEVEVSI